MMGIGSLAFMLQGLLHEPEIIWSLFLTNLITAACSVIIFSIKIYNDYIKK
jgi:MtN3 and saliva related transmembrane protein